MTEEEAEELAQRMENFPFLPHDTALVHNVGATRGMLMREAAQAIRKQQARIEELESLVIQYRDDLRHPPERGSRGRRLEAIEAALTDVQSTQDWHKRALAAINAVRNRKADQ